MISALNRLQRLSGSRWILLLVAVLTITSCSSTKSVTKRKRPRKTTVKKPRSTKTKVDTMTWTDKTRDPIVDDTPVETEIEEPVTDATIKDSYHVTAFVPLGDSRSGGSQRFLDFYAGMKLACMKLESEGANLQIDIVNSDEENTLSNKVRSNTDLIMAPFEKAKVRSVASYAKTKDITVVSPWFSSSKAAKDSPNYIQLKPNVKEHYVKLVNHVTSNFKPEEVAIVGVHSRSMSNIFKYIQGIARVNVRSNDEKVFAEHYVLRDSLAQGEQVYLSQLEDGKKVFIFPYYKMQDEVVLYSALRRLIAEKQYETVYAYALPLALESDKIAYDFYADLNMRIVSTAYIDNDSPEVQYFRRRFLEEYGKFPSSDAYEGFDKMLFVGRGLDQHGTKFGSKLKQDDEGYLHTEYRLEPVYKADDESFTKIDYYENKHLYILEFVDGRFVKRK